MSKGTDVSMEHVKKLEDELRKAFCIIDDLKTEKKQKIPGIDR